MTTPNNQPMPPPGMRLLTPEESKQPLPVGAMFKSHNVPGWMNAKGFHEPDGRPYFGYVYAIPITPTATGDTTNEKGGELCAENTKIVSDAEDQSALNVSALADKSHPASNAALAVPSHEQRPIPKPLFPCKHCYEGRTWPAEDLYWSEIENGWVCIECWDDETHGEEPGATLQEEIDTPTAPVEQRQELLPCPFCGSSQVELSDSDVPKINARGQKVAVFCNDCFCEGPTADHESEAMELWNTRK